MNIVPKFIPMIVGNNRQMVGAAGAAFGSVIYDGTHVGSQGTYKSTKKSDEGRGTTVPCGKEADWSLSYLDFPFLTQVKRVLKPNGLLLAKIADMVISHRAK